MSDNNSFRRRSCWLIACLLVVVPLRAQDASPERPYALVAYVGGGLSYYVATPGTPSGVPVDLSRTGLAGTVRLMWQPDHLLRLGIETGWTKFYSYKLAQTPPGEMQLAAIPVMMVWSMPLFGVDLFAGTGYYHLMSNLEYEGSTSVATWSLGWLVAASYTRPLTETLGVAGEVKWMNAIEHEDANLSFEVQLVWKVFEW